MLTSDKSERETKVEREIGSEQMFWNAIESHVSKMLLALDENTKEPCWMISSVHNCVIVRTTKITNGHYYSGGSPISSTFP